MRVLEPEGVYDTPEEVAAFDAFASRYFPFGSWLFVRRAVRLCPVHGQVLDIGAGGGQLAILLARSSKVPIVTALDASAHMLHLAQERAVRYNVVDRVRFMQADASAKLPFDDHVFDIVICHLMLHEVRDLQKFLREVRRVVKPEGAVLIKDIVRMPPIILRAAPWRLFSLNTRFARQSFNSWRAALSYRELCEVRDALGSNYVLSWNFFWVTIYPKH